jgi:hypothetical protein
MLICGDSSSKRQEFNNKHHLHAVMSSRLLGLNWKRI